MANGVARIPEPWEWIRTKRCSNCREVKPWAKFSPAGYLPDGNVRTVVSACQACCVGKAKERFARYRARHLDHHRAYQREYLRRRKAEVAAERGDGPLLPAEPFCVWLSARAAEYDGNWAVLADACGSSVRVLKRLGGQERVSLGLVDRCVTALGAHVVDLYPEVYEDGLCGFCRDEAAA